MINCAYIHIPFCAKKCKYCSFCSFTLLNKKDIYIEALIKEIKAHYYGETLKTIYFGGGTPSLMDIKDIEKILSQFKYNSDTQITLELNPKDVSIDKLKALYDLNINRLSIGVQSFDDRLLKLMGRNHKTIDVYKVIENAKNIGFNNISIDLMYGLPNQTLSIWEKTLDCALNLDIEHISLYGLKIEEGCYWAKFPPLNLPDIDIQADMQALAFRVLKEKFKHYEFSNFAREEKYYSIHNLAYWLHKNYYGFGLSASGLIQNKRYTNTFNFGDYIKNPIERNFEELTKQQLVEEEIFLGLRLSQGINFSEINRKYNIDIYKTYKNIFDKFLSYNLLEKTADGVKLTLEGVMVSNEVLCEFISV